MQPSTNTNVRPFTPKPRATFVAKGHDAKLKEFQDRKTPVLVTFMSGERIGGIVSNRDKYTITIKDTTYETVVYKHAIESFRAVGEAV